MVLWDCAKGHGADIEAVQVRWLKAQRQATKASKLQAKIKKQNPGISRGSGIIVLGRL